MAKKDAEKKLIKLRERFSRCVEADQTNRRWALDDLKFLHEPGAQWDQRTRAERGDRPCYEFNKLRVTIKRVVNDMRSNRPMGKVRGQEDGDKQVAEIYEGLIRNIWNCCDGDTVIDQAAEYQVGAGMGAWRVAVEYADDSAFEQDICIEPIQNPLCLWADPAAQDPLKRDAEYWFLTSRMSKSAYAAKWPKAEAVSFSEHAEFDDEGEWEDEDSVRIVEYWYKEPVTKTLALLSDGSTVDASVVTMDELAKRQLTVVRSRVVQTHAIKMCIASGNAILEEADWAGREFPFVLVYGESIVIDGKHRWFGLTRFAKDAQRSYNYSRTLAIETVALAPQAKFWATPAQANGHTEKWAEAHKKNYPFLLYNADPQAGGPPMQMAGPQIPGALINEMQLASDDIKAVTGIYDASLGNRSNETTGVAIRARQAQGEIAVFNYMDNHAKGIRRTWEILIDLIPKVYDTPRVMRVLGVDGAEKYVNLNQPDPITGAVLNDLTKGKYDVTITVGPSFATQRQEAAEVYMNMAQANPQMFSVAADLVFKAVDLPYSDQIAERMKAMLPPQIQQMEAQGQNMSPEVMQAMAQAEQAMQMVQQQAQLVQQAATEAEGLKAESEKAAADLAAQGAKLNADYQRMLADIAKKEAALTLREAELTAQATQAGVSAESEAVAAERETLGVQLQGAVAAMQTQVAEFMAQAAQTISTIQQNSQPSVIVANPPKSKTVRVRRVNGELIGTVEEN